MEFDFDVHKIFLDPITKLDSNLIPARRPLISSSEAQKQIMTVIDEIGKASAKAQGLPAPITSASRMQTNQHPLYILKDCTAKAAGRGVVIGFLKVGYKKLFVLDHKGSHIEIEPLCILDFYIHESLQRNGFGKEVFSFMLRTEQVEPQHLAIDRPSEKFLSFLRKHYNLRSTIPQVNNFVIFEGFFQDRKASVKKLPPKRTEGEIKPYSLSDREFLKHDEGLPWPFSQSPQSSLNRACSLGSSPTRPRQSPGGEDFMKSLRVCRPHSLHRAANGEQEDSPQRRRTSGMNLSRGLMAQQNCYSRYTAASPPRLRRTPSAVDIKENPCDANISMNKNETSDVASLDRQLTNNSPHPLLNQKPPQHTTAHSKQESPIETQSLERPKDLNRTSAPDVPRTQEDPSWTVLGTVMDAQWVRRKQEIRGTRPW